jgi:hypothetical protein
MHHQLRGEWFDENELFIDIAGQHAVIEYRNGEMIDSQTGQVIRLEAVMRSDPTPILQLIGWPNGQTFAIHPADAAKARAVRDGLI